ncbi:sensor histidine kinase [Serinicoccus sediminis]|uniref:sensor histidine kinase n=1 Tax=Serinicoccus sediminis TaxID=2306021 RepID=UPI00101EEEDC|nr:histidine kinase [Serinicoccus sediminis]
MGTPDATHRPPQVAVRLPAVATAALAAVAAVSTVDDLRFASGDPARVLVLVLAGLSLAFVGLTPWAGVPLLWLALVLSAVTGAVAPVLLPVALVTCVTQATAPRWLSLMHLGAATVGVLVTLARHTELSTSSALWGAALLVLVAAAVGELLRWVLVARRQQAVMREEARRREEAHRVAVEQVRQQERAALARALHDVVASELTVIATSIGAARTEVDRDRWEETLQVVDEASSAALLELRELLEVATDRPGGVVGGTPGHRGEDEARELPSDRVARLAGTARKLGREVELQLDPSSRLDQTPGPGPETVVRVVREAITNAIRHAGPGPIRVVVTGSGDGPSGELRVEVSSPLAEPGTGTPFDDGARRGLAGLRTSVEDAGGELGAGATEDGKWQVRARVPRDPAAAPHGRPG